MIDSQLVFILGQPRSGTTMLQKILGNSEEVYTKSESWLLLYPGYLDKNADRYSDYDTDIENRAITDLMSDLPGGEDEFFQHLFSGYKKMYSSILESKSAKVYLDKTPRYYLIIRRLLKEFPEGKFVWVYRDPMAVLASIFRTWLDKSHIANFYKYEKDLKLAPFIAKALMDETPDNLKFVKYEELVDDKENVVRDICSFAGIKFDDSMLTMQNQESEEWLLGDPNRNNGAVSPVIGPALWSKAIDTAQKWRLFSEYLEFLGDTYDQLGYDSGSAREELERLRPDESDLSKTVNFDIYASRGKDLVVENKHLSNEIKLLERSLASANNIKEIVAKELSSETGQLKRFAVSQSKFVESMRRECVRQGEVNEKQMNRIRQKLISAMSTARRGRCKAEFIEDALSISSEVAVSKTPLLITGSHRSGSTWIGRVFESSGMFSYIDEPYNIDKKVIKSIKHWFHYTKEQDTSVYNYLYNASSKCSDKGKRALFKDPIAFFSVGTFVEKLGADVLISVRHPAAFASSLKRLGWGHDFSHFMAQEELMDDLLYPYRDQVKKYAEKEQDIVDQASLLWNLIYHTALRFSVKYPSIVMAKHEDLSMQPEAEYKKLFKKFGVPYNKSVEDYIADTTKDTNETEAVGNVVHQLKRNSKENVKTFQHRLDGEEIKAVQRATYEVAGVFYQEDSWM